VAENQYKEMRREKRILRKRRGSMKNEYNKKGTSIHSRRVGDFNCWLMKLGRNLDHILKHAETVHVMNWF
jgi:hypothetical protein